MMISLRNERKCPRIISSSWGSIEAEGIDGCRDLKLWPGGGRSWDWGETNTHHDPGIQLADIQELLDHGAQIIILSTGRENALQVPPETVAALQGQQINVHVMETSKAIDLYNKHAAEADLVGGLFHTTC